MSSAVHRTVACEGEEIPVSEAGVTTRYVLYFKALQAC